MVEVVAVAGEVPGMAPQEAQFLVGQAAHVGRILVVVEPVLRRRQRSRGRGLAVPDFLLDEFADAREARCHGGRGVLAVADSTQTVQCAPPPMLFNSYVFLLAFLPLAVVAFYALNRVSRTLAVLSLVAFSLYYYAWWDVRYVPLLVGSILANYALGRRIQSLAPAQRRAATALTVAGIVANLALLAYFKYAHFLAAVVGLGGSFGSIVLPLAISFYTFQQIMYLVDSLRGAVAKEGLLQYTRDGRFFPHLVAGPLWHRRAL